MFDKQTGLIRASNTASVFAINGFYSDEVEASFARLEAKLSSGLKSILGTIRGNPRSIRPRDDEVLACCRRLLYTQLLRTPFAWELGKSALKDYDVDDFIGRLKASFVLDEDDIRREVHRQLEDASKDRGSDLWADAMGRMLSSPAAVSPRLFPAIYNKGITFGIAPPRSTFVLGDRGVVSTATQAEPLTHPSRELFFPVSPDISISVAGRRNQLSSTSVGVDQVRQINRSTIECATRYVVSHSGGLLRALR